MGISGFVVDWYGESQPFSDHNFALMQEAADESHFQVALLYNESADEDAQATDDAMSAMDKAYKRYIGPQAPHRNAYLTYNGHPVIFIFPKHGHVDWDRIVQALPIMGVVSVFSSIKTSLNSNISRFRGTLCLGTAGAKGWTPDGSNWGEQYLDEFYKNMRNNIRTRSR